MFPNALLLQRDLISSSLFVLLTQLPQAKLTVPTTDRDPSEAHHLCLVVQTGTTAVQKKSSDTADMWPCTSPAHTEPGFVSHSSTFLWTYSNN